MGQLGQEAAEEGGGGFGYIGVKHTHRDAILGFVHYKVSHKSNVLGAGRHAGKGGDR